MDESRLVSLSPRSRVQITVTKCQHDWQYKWLAHAIPSILVVHGTMWQSATDNWDDNDKHFNIVSQWLRWNTFQHVNISRVCFGGRNWFIDVASWRQYLDDGVDFTKCRKTTCHRHPYSTYVSINVHGRSSSWIIVVAAEQRIVPTIFTSRSCTETYNDRFHLSFCFLKFRLRSYFVVKNCACLCFQFVFRWACIPLLVYHTMLMVLSYWSSRYDFGFQPKVNVSTTKYK